MPVWHVSPHARPWTCDKTFDLDAWLSESGSQRLSVANDDWSGYELEPDGEHFTRESLPLFLKDLSASVAPSLQGSSWLLLTDSTIDHHNYTAKGEHTGWASNLAREMLPGQCRVDAVCGSGFLAMASANNHFYPRMMQSVGEIRNVVLLGGWNDLHKDNPARLHAAVAKLVGTVLRHDELPKRC